MDRRVLTTCVHSGSLLTALYGGGILLFARMIPADSPQLSADQVVTGYLDNTTGIRIGMTMIMLGAALMISWGTALAILIRRGSPRHAALLYVQLAAAVTAAMNGIMLSLTGALAAYRAGQISPEITQTLHDLFWILWVFPGSTFEIWALAAGAGILLAPRESMVFPRWSGYFSLLVAFSFLPGFLGIFAKKGALAYNGLLPWWIPTVMFFLWAVVMSPLMMRAVRIQGSDDAQDAVRPPGNFTAPAPLVAGGPR